MRLNGGSTQDLTNFAGVIHFVAPNDLVNILSNMLDTIKHSGVLLYSNNVICGILDMYDRINPIREDNTLEFINNTSQHLKLIEKLYNCLSDIYSGYTGTLTDGCLVKIFKLAHRFEITLLEGDPLKEKIATLKLNYRKKFFPDSDSQKKQITLVNTEPSYVSRLQEQHCLVNTESSSLFPSHIEEFIDDDDELARDNEQELFKYQESKVVEAHEEFTIMEIDQVEIMEEANDTIADPFVIDYKIFSEKNFELLRTAFSCNYQLSSDPEIANDYFSNMLDEIETYLDKISESSAKKPEEMVQIKNILQVLQKISETIPAQSLRERYLKIKDIEIFNKYYEYYNVQYKIHVGASDFQDILDIFRQKFFPRKQQKTGIGTASASFYQPPSKPLVPQKSSGTSEPLMKKIKY